ncbi:Zn-ribbon domain-containing OB-fold protein [Mycobacterium sp. E2497]|uniref:Zn-ribbon domain-containing OB-fold protein n=1 Tax=Mycobacterium sp. E2497 TaxID=1834135 RepID=UPI0007FCD87F|nr:OB-fold domain-containing protein [Mycobacterium sp. E2497]OBI17584.1 hypothetical protein A5713_19940 [Mycobacterium sp. E2497]
MTTHIELPPPIPLPDPDSAQFWEGLKNGKLMMCRCVETGKWIHPPLECSRFTGGPVYFEAVRGTGTVYSFIVVRQLLVPGRPVPHVIGLVELDDQPGLRISAVINADPDAVQIGKRVRLRITPLGDSGYRVAEFEITDDAS